LEVLADTGPDLFAIETIPLLAEAEIVVEELRSLTDAPAWVTFSCADELHTCGGDSFAAATARVAPAVSAIGVNCTAPGLVEPLLRSADVVVPFVIYPNHGAAWDADHKCWIGPTGGAELPGHLPAWLAAGARLIGGCCGVGSEGIRALNAWRNSHT
jgi:homocysteine S-methyltransferase